MSFSDRPGFTAYQWLGCVVYFVVSGLIAVFFMLNAALGDCPSATDCISETTRALMFYGSPLLALAGGALLIKYMMREQD